MKDKYRKIWIKWLDSVSADSRWVSPKSAEEYIKEACLVCESVGFLLYEDEEVLGYCESLDFIEGGGVNSVNGISLIPIVAIIDWKWLE